tara:strand:- start:311 stop:1930 length:1620 start_codon:yes stop_codon:yes gene_type:complete
MSQSNFTGEVTTDFMKKVIIPDDRKDTLIDYASSDFLSLRNSIIEYVKAVYPLDYQNFSETDLGIMLVEVVAYMGSVLSLKADMLANESFLATARNRSNVQKLLELVGVRMRGPLAAAANAQLTIPIALGASQNAITIPPSGRTITITSPEDGGRLTYTLYRISAGRIVDSNADSTVYLNKEEANDPTSAEVWTNIALLEGAFVVQRGTFTSYDSIKSLTLNQSPVIEGSIQVYVDAPNVPNASGSFSQVESLFFASGATDKIFQTNLNESFGGTIVFGDGVAGISPPIGSTYEVAYRIGGGTRGNVQKSFINAAANVEIDGNPANTLTSTVENISMATGGSNAESVDHAKKWAPLFFKSQDRLVTLEDYVARASRFISSYGSIGKVTAAVRKAYSSANTIDVFVLERASDIQLQQATTSFKMELLTHLQEKKMLTDEIVIVDGVVRSLDLVMTISVDKNLLPREGEIKAQTRNAVLDYFNNQKFDFEDPFIITDFTRIIFNSIDTVRFATVDNVASDIYIEFNEIIQLNNVVINVKGV